MNKRVRSLKVKCAACGDEFSTRGGQIYCGECALEQLLMPKMFAFRLALKAKETVNG